MKIIIYHGINKIKEFTLDPPKFFNRLGPITEGIRLVDLSISFNEYAHLYAYNREEANQLIEGLLGL